MQGKHVHGSSIIELPNGDFLACWFHGSGERRAKDVLIQGSRLKRGESNWSDVFIMAEKIPAVVASYKTVSMSDEPSFNVTLH